MSKYAILELEVNETRGDIKRMPIVSRDIIDVTDCMDVSTGRKRIYTELEPTEENILKILNDSLSVHEYNRVKMQRLINYYLGNQKILNRNTKYTSNVNNKLVINYANSVVRDIVGYTFGKDIEYVQKKSELISQVEELNKILQYEDSSLTDLVTATYASICGVGYQCTLPSDDYDENPEIGIEIGSLDPRNTFVVHSYEFKNPVILACNYYQTPTKKVYTIWDKEYRTKIVNNKIIEHELHGLSDIPITEFENNEFLLGDFEIATTILDAINQVASDCVNDIENNIQSLLVLVNATLGETADERKETREDIVKNRILEIKAPQGLQADAKYISTQLDSQATTDLREYLEECLWKVLGIPDRKTRGGGGGDTGDAVKLRDGWADIEVVARNKEKYFRKAKKKQLALAIELLKTVKLLDKSLSVKEIDIKFSRNKSDNLSTKTQAYSVLTATQTLDPTDALEIVDITTNVNEVINRGKKYWESKQSTVETEGNEIIEKDNENTQGEKIQSQKETEGESEGPTND